MWRCANRQARGSRDGAGHPNDAIGRACSSPSSRSFSANVSRGPPEKRDQHSNLVAVLAILIAIMRDEVFLLEEDANENVGCRHTRKEKVAGCHDRRRPECDDETEVDGVSDKPVEEGRLERGS